MSGIELRDGEVVVGREPNELDDLAVEFSTLLEELGIDHVFVAGYVAILAGRSRATEDIDVLVERVDGETIGELVERLEDASFWGPAMPLEEMAEMLSGNDNIWIARDDEVIPHLEVKYPSDEFDRASLENSITARIGDAAVPIGPLELQIAYKLYLGTQKDFEDAIHLYTLFGESLRTNELETWVTKLGVEDEYERLERA